VVLADLYAVLATVENGAKDSSRFFLIDVQEFHLCGLWTDLHAVLATVEHGAKDSSLLLN
jgi:hypothetical protein